MTAPAPTAEAREIRCPRCAYDQRGALSTWHESCPLEGICTECGLTFRWCEVLLPQKFEPQWCIEFEPRASRLYVAAMRTGIRSFWPRGFWSRLRMSHDVRWVRLALYAMLIWLPLLFAYVGAQTYAALYVRGYVEDQLSQQARTRPAQIQNLQTTVQSWANMPPTGDPQHDAYLANQVASMKIRIAAMQALGTARESIDASWLETTWEAIAHPLSMFSDASIVGPTGLASGPYVPPISLLSVITQARGAWNDDILQWAILPGAWLAWGMAMTLLMPLSFILMPLSLRKAKVRWSHIVRVTVYSLAVPMFCMLVALTALWLAVLWQDRAIVKAVYSAARYVPWLAVALWWHAATVRYLKIPHAWLTIGLLTLLCLLALLGITCAISVNLAMEMLDLFEPLIA